MKTKEQQRDLTLRLQASKSGRFDPGPQLDRHHSKAQMTDWRHSNVAKSHEVGTTNSYKRQDTSLVHKGW